MWQSDIDLCVPPFQKGHQLRVFFPAEQDLPLIAFKTDGIIFCLIVRPDSPDLGEVDDERLVAAVVTILFFRLLRSTKSISLSRVS